jgi:hypothetical protein
MVLGFLSTGASGQPINHDVVVSFGGELTAAELEEITGNEGFMPLEIMYRREDMQGGYKLSGGENLSAAVERMNLHHEDFLKRVIDRNTRALSEAGMSDKDRQRIRFLTDKFQRALVDFQENGLKYSSIRMRNRPQVITRLMRDRKVVGVTPAFSRTSGQSGDVRAEEEGARSEVGNSYYHESWAPYSGISDVVKTYTYQTFYFNSLYGFPSDGTYEHETQVYNSNFADYDGYWSSDLPQAYYDTAFLDTLDNFTVGCAEATSIVLYREYYTYMALRGGSAATATVRIKGQRGNRTPAWCYSTWCIFADQTTASMATFTAPATYVTWTY